MIALYMLVLICVGMLTCLVWVVLTTKDSEEEAKREGVLLPWIGLILVCTGFMVTLIEYGVLPALTSLLSLF